MDQRPGAAANRWVWLVLLAAWLAGPAPVRGQEKVGTTVDLFRGPVVSSSRVIGLGGSYAGIAEGVQGVGHNAASLGNRYPYSTDWFDWDLAFDWINLLPGDVVDMDNDGVTSGDEEFLALNAGLSLLSGCFGIGVWISGDTYTLANQAQQVKYGFVHGFLGATYAFRQEQLVVGLGLATASLDVTTYTNKAPSGAEPEWHEEGDASWGKPGGQFALLWRPHDLPMRIGLDASLPITVATDLDEAPDSVAGISVPERLYVPWRVALGSSYYHSFGGHPYNVRRRGAHNPFFRQSAGPPAKADQPIDRRYILAAVDLVVHGPAPAGAVGTGSFATGTLRRSGERPSLSIHGGVESEFWNNRMVARAGTYLEPPRLEGADFRMHGTLGAEVRLFRLWRWQLRLGASFDVARDYLNWGLGIGFWH